MKRRDFIKVGGAGMASAFIGGMGLVSWQSRAYAATITKTYYITNGLLTMADNSSLYFRGFSESASSVNVPGKPLIVQQGDTVNISIVNTLGTSHSFVIDGIVDSGTIAGGAQKTISFTAGTPGTYMFYDKLNAPYNRVTGLHGSLAIMPSGISNQLYKGSPTFVQQYFWVFNDIDPAWNNAVRVGSTPSSAFKPRYFTVNGLSSRPPGALGHGNPAFDAMSAPDTSLVGKVGSRTLVRVLNAGLCSHSLHIHGNHMEWLTKNGQIRPAVWKKDVIFLNNNMGKLDMIYPFETPPDAYPASNTGCYPMHLHDEMSQTAAGGSYMFGAMTDVYFI